MERRLARTVAILLVVAVLGGIMLRRQAGKVAQATREMVPVDTAAVAPPTDSATYVAAAVAAHDAVRRVRGVAPRTVRVASFEPDSAGVVLKLVGERADSAVWVRVYADGRTTVAPFRP